MVAVRKEAHTGMYLHYTIGTYRSPVFAAFNTRTLWNNTSDKIMLATLPDECKRKIWRHFEAQELCRVACVARDISNGANADAVWKQRTRALITREQTRAAALRTPVECGLTRQNARRDLLAAKSSSLAPANNLLARMSRLTSRDENGSAGGGHGARNSDDDVEVIAEDSTYWRHWYRDFHVVSRGCSSMWPRCTIGSVF